MSHFYILKYIFVWKNVFFYILKKYVIVHFLNLNFYITQHIGKMIGFMWLSFIVFMVFSNSYRISLILYGLKTHFICVRRGGNSC